MDSWREQAVENLQRFGEQSWVVLTLATVEEIGELAQALLHYEYEDGDAERVTAELCDVAALGYQMYWKRTTYPVEVTAEVKLDDQ